MSGWVRRLPILLAEAALLVAFYLMLAGRAGVPEAAAAGVAAAGAMALRLALLGPPEKHLRLQTIVALALRTGRDAFRDGATVALALARAGARRQTLTGGFREAPRQGGMAIIALSVPPNSYVVDVTGERLILHELVRTTR